MYSVSSKMGSGERPFAAPSVTVCSMCRTVQLVRAARVRGSTLLWTLFELQLVRERASELLCVCVCERERVSEIVYE
jgi:hypothetical protein